MAVEGAPIHRNLLQEIAHAIHETRVGIGHAVQKHPYSIALASGFAVLGLGGTLLLQKVYGPSNVVDNAPTSGTLKPFEGGGPENSNVVISPGFQQGQESSNPPKPPETKVKPYDCGIFSSEVCATGEYFQLTFKDKVTGQIVTAEGMGYKVKAGELITIKEDLQVTGTEVQQPNIYHGNRIRAVRKDGKGYTITGRIGFVVDENGQPVVTRFGKDLPAGTKVAKTTESGEKPINGSDYDVIVAYPSKDELKKDNPEQTKGEPNKLTLNDNEVPMPQPPVSPEKTAINFGSAPKD